MTDIPGSHPRAPGRLRKAEVWFPILHQGEANRGCSMHLPMLHISNRQLEPTLDEDPLGLGTYEGRDLIPWLADPVKALERADKRIPSLDVLALALAAVGSEITYFGLLGGMFSAYNREAALSFAAVIVPSVAVNQLVKARFRYPRPPRQAQHPWAFVAPGDFTFPSGHAQNAVVLGLFLAYKARRKWLQALGVGLATAIPLSRLYLGVHYPRDVIVGVILGLSTVAGTKMMKQPFRRWWDNAPRGPRGFTILFALVIAGLLTGTPLAAFPLGVGGGLAVGHDLSGSTRFKLDQPSKRGRIAQGVIGVGMILGAGSAIRPLMKRESSLAATVAGGLVGVALTFGTPFFTDVVRRVRYMRQKRSAQKAKSRKRPKR